MAKEENFSSIFDAAGKMGKKKPLPEDSANLETADKAAPVSDEDVDNRYIKCKTFHEKIKKSIEDAYEKANVSPRMISQYLETPTNFPEKNGAAFKRQKVNMQQS